VHEDESLPPQLREALRIMARRGPVVELTAPTRATAGPDHLSTVEEES
jgi:hypothetical protein